MIVANSCLSDAAATRQTAAEQGHWKYDEGVGILGNRRAD